LVGPKKATAADEYVGMTVRFRRKELGLSQTELARAIGVSFQQVQKYEKGTNRIGVGRLSAISQALQTPMDYFFQAVTGADKPTTLELMRLPGAATLLAHYSKIENPAHRGTVVKLARALAGQEEDT
jgi:transcriptional regulator with XRE-family HTH domain